MSGLSAIMKAHRVVIIGSGFGGLRVSQKSKAANGR